MPIRIIDVDGTEAQYRAEGAGAFETALHIHRNSHQLIWVRSGSRLFFCCGSHLRISKNEALLIPAGVPHRGLRTDGTCSFWSRHIPANLIPMTDAILLSQGAKELPGLFLNARFPAASFERLCLAKGRRLAMPHRGKDPAVAVAHDFLNRNFTRTISLLRLSSLCGVNKYEMVRRFRRAFGVSPHAYQLQLRVDYSKTLLGKLSAADIAFRLGFADQSHFGRHFRRVTGVTPGVYKGERIC
jgi:AraC-like DNA-binding protein